MKYLGILILAAAYLPPGPATCQGRSGDRQEASALHLTDPKTPEGLQRLLSYTGDSLHLVSAHRGGPQTGFPENCLATFESTLEQTFAMMEIDPRYTKDRAIVLHHDATLERTTNGQGAVADHTLAELKRLRLRDPGGNLTHYSVPTLDEALEWARGKTILVLDQKDVSLRDRVRKIEEHRAEAFAVLIVYRLEDVKTCYSLNPKIMMEVMITNQEQLEAFESSGVPWSNIVAFVGHAPPEDDGLLKKIHANGTVSVAGTSRNLDRQLIEGRVTSIKDMGREYRELMERGIGLIETDLPREVGAFLYGEEAPPRSRAKFLRVTRP